MTIQRTINGVNFNIQLLPDELIEAFNEQQIKYDIGYVIDYAEAFSPADIQKYLRCDYQTYLKHKEIIAKQMRKYINNGLSISDAREIAVNEVINKLTTAALA